VASSQSLSGTGALRIGAEFIKKWLPQGTAILISDPTWSNHFSIFGEQGIKIIKHRYFDAKTNGLDFDGMIADIKAAPDKSVILLHTCAHNPTGVDPTVDQWKILCQLAKEKSLIPFFDCAYQGYASGDLERDAFSLRYFVSQGFECLIAQSFAKNFGLYGERAGVFSIVCSSEQVAQTVLSQIKLIVRPMYSNPPIHGAHIVATILSTPELFQEWLVELKGMSQRIRDMRQLLFDCLSSRTKNDWSHILNQIGMFTYTGLTEAQVEQLTGRFHIYMLKNGRISMAGLNSTNVKYVGDAFATVVQEIPSQKL